MSEQNRSVVSSSLEEVFLSGEFSRAPDEPTLAPAERADLGPGKAFDHPLEEVFLSDAFGKNGEPTLLDTSSGARAEAAGASLSPFRPMPPWRIRYRAAAAASSVAAAAMVVSVMASGGGPPGVPTIAAAGPGGGAQGGGTGSRGPADDAPNTAAPLATPADDSTASAGGNTGASVGRGGSSTPVGVLASAAGARLGVVPSPASTGTGGRAGTIAPVAPGPPSSSPGPTQQSGSGNGLSGLTTTVGNTMNTVSAAVTSTAGQLGAAVPATAPGARAVNGVGATVTGLGQSLGMTTT